MNGRRLPASSWFMPTRSRTSRLGASAMGCRSVIPRISPRLTQRRSRQAASDGSAVTERVESRTRYLSVEMRPRDARSCSPRSRHSSTSSRRPISSRIETLAIVPRPHSNRRSPVSGRSHSRSTDPIPRRSSPTRRPTVSTSFQDPLTPSRRSLGRSPTARIERRFNVSPSASSSSDPETWRRPSSERSRSERAARLRRPGNPRSISRSSPASMLSCTSGRDATRSATRVQASSGSDAVDPDPRLVAAQRRQLVTGPGSDPAKRVAHDGERSARPSPPARSEFAGSACDNPPRDGGPARLERATTPGPAGRPTAHAFSRRALPP